MRYLRSSMTVVKRRDADFVSAPKLIRPTLSPTIQMQAIRLQKKYPQVSQEEMLDLINRFK